MVRAGRPCVLSQARKVLVRSGMVEDRLPLEEESTPVNPKAIKKDLARHRWRRWWRSCRES